ncbi:MAG TPA: hypothetical protein VGM88_03470 [Kofleriaceae bacterium]
MALVLLIAACGDDSGGSIIDAHPHDAPVDGEAAHIRGFEVSGDYTAGDPGVLDQVDVTASAIQTDVGPSLAVGDDPILRFDAANDLLYIVNRADGNNVTIIDAATHELVEQLGTGASSNPQDVAVVGNKLYVPVYGGTGVAVLTRGSTAIDTIDLSADDPDGMPNCNSAIVAGGKVYVSCELLDDSQMFPPPRGNGMVYVIDPTSGDVTASLELSTVNPFGNFETIPAGAHAGDLVIPTVSFNDGSGCIERVATTGTPTAAGCLVENDDLGNYASRVSFSGAQMLLAVPSPDFTMAALRSYDLGTGTLATDSLTPATQIVADVVGCQDGSIVVADSTAASAGLRIYRDGGEATSTPLAIDNPSFSSHGLACD